MSLSTGFPSSKKNIIINKERKKEKKEKENKDLKLRYLLKKYIVKILSDSVEGS